LNSPEHKMNEESVVEEAGFGRRLLHWIWALALLSLLGGSGYLLMLIEPQQLPVSVVTVDGKVKHLKPERLQETVVAHLDGGILTQDLSELKAAVEAMPWVRSASLRRHWPNRLELAVVEQVPLARWGEGGLVCADGVVFKPRRGDLPRGLPKLSGRDEDARLVVESYQRWVPGLKALDLRIEELTRDERGSWSLRLSSGFTLALGKAHLEERMARFIRTYPKLVAAGMPSLVDMRYSNGLAIRWADPPADGQGSGRGVASRSAQLKSRPSGPSRS